MPLTKVASSMLAGGASGSGGSSGKNYISTYNSNTCNGDFESGSDSGWNLCTVSSISNGLPSGLTLAAGSVGKTVISTGQIAGVYSLQTVFPAVAYQGLVTDVFTIDTEDQAKVLTFKFYYNITSGASGGNFSGTSANTFIVAVYAVNGSNIGWLQPAGVYSMTQGSGGSGIATGTFQTYSDATQYRFAVLCANAPSSPMTVVFDDFSVGPQTAPIGPVETDWQSYTPTILGATATVTYAQWRRVGDSLQIEARLANSAVAASILSVSLPNNYNIDINKIPLLGVVGHATCQTGVTSVFRLNVLAVGNTSVLNFGTNLSAGNGSSLLAASDFLSFFAQIPITGWSSNVQMSNDTDTRVVACSVSNGTSATAITTTSTLCPFSNVIDDTHGSWSTSSNTYTIPVSGRYKITFQPLFNITTAAAGCQVNSFIYIDGSQVAAQRSPVASIAAFYSNPVVFENNLRAGQVISFYAQFAISGCAGTFYNDPLYSKAFIERLSGPSVIAATESVNASYYVSANFAASTTIPINFDTKEFDSHNAVTTSASAWKFTAPISGAYEISTYVYGGNPGTSVTFYLYKNQASVGTATKVITFQQSGTNSSGSCLIRLNSGDFIDMRPDSARTVTGGALNTANCSYIQIKRVGN